MYAINNTEMQSAFSAMANYDHTQEDVVIQYCKERGLDEVVSEEMVCQSAAGYYIGTMSETFYTEFGHWVLEPYERLSEYIATKELADKQLGELSWCPRI